MSFYWEWLSQFVLLLLGKHAAQCLGGNWKVLYGHGRMLTLVEL